MYGDKDYAKKHKTNSKKECKGASCPSPSGSRKLPSIKNVRNDDGMPSQATHIVKQPEYVEKVAYKIYEPATTENTGQDLKVVESGEHMTKEEREKKRRAYMQR